MVMEAGSVLTRKLLQGGFNNYVNSQIFLLEGC
jgi:hypothetical protein